MVGEPCRVEVVTKGVRLAAVGQRLELGVHRSFDRYRLAAPCPPYDVDLNVEILVHGRSPRGPRGRRPES